MNLSYAWLNHYIDLSKHTPEEIADLLTMKTCEVEKVEAFLPHLNDVLVAEVMSVTKHADADKLVICQVDAGKEKVQIVTGAPNVEAGKKYPMAGVGVTLPNGMTMKKAKLRGEESAGMLCSIGELALDDFTFGDDFGSHEKGILELPSTFEVGKSLGSQLGTSDTILDIDNKSITHRPDLWSHFGFARELAALLKKPLKNVPAELDFKTSSDVDKGLKPPKIQIEGDAALNYSGALLDGIEIKQSSLTMQARLIAAGMRPINNVVDVSNYVMLAIGQPNHAFDRSLLSDTININYSKKGETITTLDGVEHSLPSEIVLIRDGKKPVALGGVMGGENTEVKDNTTSLFLESATFHRSDIRRAVSKVGLRTEASQRFEKGQDPTNAKIAIHLFANLLKETCPNLKMGKIQSEFKQKPIKNKISTTISYIRQRLGNLKITDKQITSLLESLGLECKLNEDKLVVNVPTYRSYFDLTIADDLVEEIGRLVGYQEIAIEPVLVSCEVPQYINSQRQLEHRLRDLLSNSYHFSESFRYAFHSANDISLDGRFAKSAIELANPIHNDLAFMRISPMVGLLKNIEQFHKEHGSMRIYELERIFLKNSKTGGDQLPEEKYFVSGMVLDKASADDNLRSLSSMLADLLAKLNLPLAEQTWLPLTDDEIFHPGRAGQILGQERTLVKWGQLHPKVTDQFGLPSLYYFEALLEDLLELGKLDISYRHLVKFPASDFEITVLVDSRKPYAELIEAIGKANIVTGDVDKTYIEKVEHLTTYEGQPIEAGKKAVSIRLTWRNNTRTLKPDEIKDLQDRLIRKLEHAKIPLRA